MSRHLDIHVLQSVPYANLNRDDTGSPKTAFFGGVERIRVSSQAWKRAMRKYMEERLETLAGYDRAARTLNYVEVLAGILTGSGLDYETATHAAKVAFKDPKKGFPKDKDTQGEAVSEEIGNARVLMFLTQSQYDDLATYVLKNQEDIATAKADAADDKAFKGHREEITAIIAEPRGLVRLFGRMLAHLPIANTDSAIQVAHALTVHAQSPEYDYVTAVEDHPLDENLGAAHLVTADFAAGTFYRYASINLDVLAANGLNRDDVRMVALEAVRAFTLSMPTGKQSATAAHTFPGLLVVSVRERPENLVNAFEAPLRPRNDGYLVSAVTAIAKHAQRSQDLFGVTPSFVGHLATLGEGVDTSVFGQCTSLDGLLAALGDAV